MSATSNRCCQAGIIRDEWALSGYRKDGDVWTCPKCQRRYSHVCDEAEGCSWDLIEEAGPLTPIKVSRVP
jgi:hypothetical protein